MIRYQIRIWLFQTNCSVLFPLGFVLKKTRNMLTSCTKLSSLDQDSTDQTTSRLDLAYFFLKTEYGC